MDAIQALLIGSVVFFVICMVLMVRVCLTEDAARREAKRSGKVVVPLYDGQGRVRRLYVEDMKGGEKQ